MTHRNPFTAARKPTCARSMPRHFQFLFVAFLIATSGVFLPAKAIAQGETKPSTNRSPAKKKFRLKITEGDIVAVSLKADKASMTEIATELSKQLKTPVFLGPSLTKEALTVEFMDLYFEPAMALLAPRVYIDYEIRANAHPAMLGIFLLGHDDPEPAKNAVVKGSSQALLVEGNTEDEVPPSELDRDADPLQIDLDDNFLTIRSRKQPLVAVILTIAEVLEVPAEIRYESNEVVDTVIKDTPFEDAIARLSPNIRLYVRADLTRSVRTPLRLTLVPPVESVAGQVTSQ